MGRLVQKTTVPHSRRPRCAFALIVLLTIVSSANATVTSVTIFSPSNNRNLSFRVYTPPGYATDLSRQYPVVISLHGIGGTGQQRANTYSPTLDCSHDERRNYAHDLAISRWPDQLLLRRLI